MYKDRGTIKWTAMMLPEHVKELREWRHEVEDKRPNPLEEWELEELNEKLILAFEQQLTISVFTFEGQWHEEIGIIHKVDYERKLVFLDDSLIVKKIPIHLVYRVTFHD